MHANQIPGQMAQFVPWDDVPPAANGETISTDRWKFIRLRTGATNETNTLAAPTRAGLKVVLCCTVFGGGLRTVTVANQFNGLHNTLIFTGTGQEAELISVPLSESSNVTTFGWRLVWSCGCSLAYVA